MNLFIFSPLCSVIERISFSFDFHDFRLNRRSSYFSPHLGCSKALYAPGVGDAEGHHQEVEGVGDLNPKCSVQKVIAAEAYRQLSPPLEKKVTEILKAHPDYEKWDNPVSGTDRVTTVESPEGYTKAAKMVAEKQPASAGYRLAAQSLFRPVHFLAQDMLSGIPCRKLSTKPTEPGVDLSPPCWLL
jgi:hypothetical protein